MTLEERCNRLILDLEDGVTVAEARRQALTRQVETNLLTIDGINEDIALAKAQVRAIERFRDAV